MMRETTLGRMELGWRHYTIERVVPEDDEWCLLYIDGPIFIEVPRSTCGPTWPRPGDTISELAAGLGQIQVLTWGERVLWDQLEARP